VARLIIAGKFEHRNFTEGASILFSTIKPGYRFVAPTANTYSSLANKLDTFAAIRNDGDDLTAGHRTKRIKRIKRIKRH
jgi:hypothetical protein